MLFHEEEKTTFLPLYSYWDEHEDELLVVTYGEGDSFLCSLEAEFESGNSDEHEMGDPGYDEFHVIIADVEKTLADGPNKEGSRHADGAPFRSLSITYRHFPAHVETQAGEVVYQR